MKIFFLILMISICFEIFFLILMISICFGCSTIHMTTPDETAAVTAADYELTIVGPPKKADVEGLY